jgi:hypothetical protein
MESGKTAIPEMALVFRGSLQRSRRVSSKEPIEPPQDFQLAIE